MSPRQAWNDALAALGLLSRLPLPSHVSRGADAAWAYPLAGTIVGGLAGLAGWLMLALGLPPAGAAVVVLLCATMMTGALHQDGLADLADGLWGGQTAERRLAIMKDSHIGAYGVLALVLSVLAQWAGLSALLERPGAWGAIVGAATLSRATMPVMMAAMPNARESGLSRAVGMVSPAVAGAAIGIGLGAAAVCFGLKTAVVAVAMASLITLAMGRLAMKKIGGQTGDVLGATQQVAEIAILFVLVSS